MAEENQLEQDQISWQQQKLNLLPRQALKVSGKAFGGSTTIDVGTNPVGSTLFSSQQRPAPAQRKVRIPLLRVVHMCSATARGRCACRALAAPAAAGRARASGVEHRV